MPDFKPSEVVLTSVPLCDTMRRAELEFAAAIIVRACQALGDTWQPVTLAQAIAVMEADHAEKREPFCSLIRNPFFNTDFRGLVDSGFARCLGDGPDVPLELTEAGLAKLTRWVRRHA